MYGVALLRLSGIISCSTKINTISTMIYLKPARYSLKEKSKICRIFFVQNSSPSVTWNTPIRNDKLDPVVLRTQSLTVQVEYNRTRLYLYKPLFVTSISWSVQSIAFCRYTIFCVFIILPWYGICSCDRLSTCLLIWPQEPSLYNPQHFMHLLPDAFVALIGSTTQFVKIAARSRVPMHFINLSACIV